MGHITGQIVSRWGDSKGFLCTPRHKNRINLRISVPRFWKDKNRKMDLCLVKGACNGTPLKGRKKAWASRSLNWPVQRVSWLNLASSRRLQSLDDQKWEQVTSVCFFIICFFFEAVGRYLREHVLLCLRLLQQIEGPGMAKRTGQWNHVKSCR